MGASTHPTLAAPLFSKWLYYGLATIFSSVMLAVMADISADLVEMMAKSLFVSKGLLEFITGEGVGGVAQAATQQLGLGLGLILSTLLITAPPMAGMWFNGVMGSFTPYSAFNGWNSSSSQALPPNVDGGRSMTDKNILNSNIPKDNLNTRNTTQQPIIHTTATNSLNSSNISTKNNDEIKRYLGNELSSPNNLNNYLFQPNINKVQTTDKTRPTNGVNDEKA